MAIKKSARLVHAPGIHPGLMEKIRDAEKAELRGELPRELGGAQKITRPTIDVSTETRLKQTKTTGLVDGAQALGVDGRDILAKQAPFRPGEDLDEIWDTLSEGDKIRAGGVERFRLEMESTLRRRIPAWKKPHHIGGRLDQRNLDRLVGNLVAKIDGSASLLASDSRALMVTFFKQTAWVISVCLRQKIIAGITARELSDILNDWCDKLIYQELASRERAMGDRGVRRILGNVQFSDVLYDGFARDPTCSPKERLLARLIHVHQDLGYTAYAARVSFRGGRMHRAYSARIFSDELNRYRSLFTHSELNLAMHAIATHSLPELPFAHHRVMALVRVVDHLAPFAQYRIYKHFEDHKHLNPFLEAMRDAVTLRDWEAFIHAKQRFFAELPTTFDEPILVADLMASIAPFEKMFEPVDLGPWAGEATKLGIDFTENASGIVHATIRSESFAERFQILFDVQQSQLAAVARKSGVKISSFPEVRELRFAVQQADSSDAPGYGALLLKR